MKRIDLLVTDAMFEALCNRAVVEGSKRSNRTGVQSVILHAVRPYLIRNDNRAEILDLDDQAYAKHRGKG